MSSPQFPEPPPSVPATSREDIDEALKRLSQNKTAWGKLPIKERLRFLQKCLDRTAVLAQKWGDAVSRATGIDPSHPLSGDGMLSAPYPVMRNLRQLIRALEAGGQPRPMKWMKKNGQDVARVYPMDTIEKVLFANTTIDVWIEPGKPPTQGRIYREKDTSARVGLVLAAGNVGSIGPTDILYKLFVENEVVITKMNPVNEYNGEYINEAFKPLVDAGYFAVVYGGAEVGQYLCSHELVETIHITGSDRTFDAIVWGATPEEQKKNKEAGTPINTREITSELGCVSPVFVVPGEWSEKELAHQAEQVASTMTHSASFACAAGKVLLLAKGWPQKEEFLEKFHEILYAADQRKAYYPGAQERYDQFLENYPQAKAFGERTADIIPWTIIPGVKPSKEEYALSTEAFCGLVAEVELDVTTAEDFLNESLRVANEECWGSLSCSLVIDPRTEKANQETFDHFIANLRYGGIAINAWGGTIFGMMNPTWGAHPGNTMEDIRSGMGTVHNTFLFDHPQKSVLKMPFVMKPKPPWFPTHKNLRGLANKLVRLEQSPSLLKLPGVGAAAFKG
jgi:acyl-CoA reductase-like NAD-dependent aldehyde dehydrogenase